MLIEKIKRFNQILDSQFGINLRKFIYGIFRSPFYIYEFIKFRNVYSGRMLVAPWMHDCYEDAGAIKNEYFWQDLIVARWVHVDNPLRHVDVGSRVDGFVSHVASFREIEVLDIRPVDIDVPGILFHQVDLMKSEIVEKLGLDYCDSLSCLHAIEHFGLGRYGDPILVNGYELGIKNISRLLKLNGRLYLSAPIGKQRVEFNANWVFDPMTIISCAKSNGLQLLEFVIVRRNGGLERIAPDELIVSQFGYEDYNLGVFKFIKNY
jgi:hypothetical protein